MEKGLDFFDAWVKTQKGFFESSLKSQEILRSQWLEAMQRTQEAFLNSASASDNPQAKEALKLYTTWFNLVINSSEVFNEELLRMQKSWGKVLENQLEQNKELAKVLSDFLTRQAENNRIEK